LGILKPNSPSHFPPLLSPPRFQIPSRYYEDQWPKQLHVNHLVARFGERTVTVTLSDGTDLGPRVPFSQLAQFLNNHVSGSVENVSFSCTNPQFESQLLGNCMNGVNAGRFRGCQSISFYTFFRFLPWNTIRQLFHTVLRSRRFDFYNLQLPAGVDPNDFLQLRAIRECNTIMLYPLTGGDLDRSPVFAMTGPSPKFSSEALLEWLKKGEENVDMIILRLPEDCIVEGLEGFVAAVREVGRG
jgi:hypothetical protein